MQIFHTVPETSGSDSGCFSELSSTNPETANIRYARFGATTVVRELLDLSLYYVTKIQGNLKLKVKIQNEKE